MKFIGRVVVGLLGTALSLFRRGKVQAAEEQTYCNPPVEDKREAEVEEVVREAVEKGGYRYLHSSGYN